MKIFILVLFALVVPGLSYAAELKCNVNISVGEHQGSLLVSDNMMSFSGTISTAPLKYTEERMLSDIQISTNFTPTRPLSAAEQTLLLPYKIRIRSVTTPRVSNADVNKIEPAIDLAVYLDKKTNDETYLPVVKAVLSEENDAETQKLIYSGRGFFPDANDANSIKPANPFNDAMYDRVSSKESILSIFAIEAYCY